VADLTAPCIEAGARSDTGYGRVTHEGKQWAAHRLAWTLAHGPIPDGMLVLHHCDNRACWNVEHLFLGSQADNMADMVAKGRHANQAKTHCAKGHPYDDANTWTSPSTGERACRACLNDRQRRYRASKAQR
jgi:hypothetical protein